MTALEWFFAFLVAVDVIVVWYNCYLYRKFIKLLRDAGGTYYENR